jgi:hypothetical protein
VVSNLSVIINISQSDIKKRIVSFVLIKNLCIVDLFGAVLVLPFPLVATVQGDKIQEQAGTELCQAQFKLG